MAATRLQTEHSVLKHLFKHEAYEVQFALSQVREVERPIRGSVIKDYASHGQLELQHHAGQIRRSQFGRAA